MIEEIKIEMEPSNIYHILDNQHSPKQKANTKHDQNFITHYQKTVYTVMVDMEQAANALLANKCKW